jgi:hypothetical protein
MEQNAMIEKAKELKALIDHKKSLEEEVKEMNRRIDTVQESFVEMMEHQDVQNFSVRDLGMFYVCSDIHPRMVDQEALFADLKSRGADSLIKPTIHSRTLKAYVKECLENKNEVPQGVEIFTKTSVRIRKN